MDGFRDDLTFQNEDGTEMNIVEKAVLFGGYLEFLTNAACCPEHVDGLRNFRTVVLDSFCDAPDVHQAFDDHLVTLKAWNVIVQAHLEQLENPEGN